MSETIGPAGVAVAYTVASAIQVSRVAALVPGSNQIQPHSANSVALGVALESGQPGGSVRILGYGRIVVEFDNTPIAGNLLTIAGDKGHDSGATLLVNISVLDNVLGRIAIPRPDIGPHFADCFVVIPVVSGLKTGILSAVSPPLGGTHLTAGNCIGALVPVPGAVVGMEVSVTPLADPGDAVYWKGFVSAPGVVSVRVCAASPVTPAITTYQVRVNP